jgi:hypothetical protein
MSDSQNPNGHPWSVVRKTQIIGTLLGLFLTIAAMLVLSFHKHKGPVDPGADYIDIAASLGMLLAWPAIQLCTLCGMDLRQPSGFSLAVLYSLVVIINSFLSFLIGTLAGLMIKQANKKKIKL